MAEFLEAWIQGYVISTYVGAAVAVIVIVFLVLKLVGSITQAIENRRRR